MKSAKETLQERFSGEYEKYYLVDLFKNRPSLGAELLSGAP